MKTIYPHTIGEIRVAPEEKLTYYVGENEHMLKTYEDLLFTHGLMGGISIKVYNRPELDDLAYEVCCVQCDEACLENPDKGSFMEKRKASYAAYVKRVRKMTELAERIEANTGKQAELYRKGDGTLTLLVDTNYDGPYPPKETYEAITKVSRIAGNKNHLKMWTHPMKVCCYISDSEGGENA